VLVVGVVGAMLAGGGGDDPAPVRNDRAATQGPAVAASASGISLKVPAGWSDDAAAPEVPGLAAGAVTLGGTSGGSIVFGKADETAANSTLLPDDLRGGVPEKQTVDLGDGVQAFRYDKLSIGGGNTATVFAVPTSAGVATLACVAPEKTCETVASSLRITDGKPFPVGPSKDYAADVEGALGKLEKQEKSAASALGQARTRTSQAAATSRLAGAYAGAARSLDRVQLSPADVLLNAQLVDSLRAAGSAYKKAADEGQRKDRAGFKREGARALAAGKDLDTALDGLGSAGYTLKSSLVKGAASVTVLPTLIKEPKRNVSSSAGAAHSQAQSTATPQANTNTTPQTNTQPQTQPQTQSQPQSEPQAKPKPKSDSGVTGGGEG
jgi:hypothetical protein